MKLKDFNKIGGTEYRVGNQINGYISFANWYLEAEKKDDEHFKLWARENGIYNYDKTNTNGKKEINRLRFVLRNAEKIFKVLKKCNGEWELNFCNENYREDILNNLTKIKNLSKTKDIETCLAFKKMLDFMIENPRLNDAKKIFSAFAVCEENDSFLELYNIDNIPNKISLMLIPNGKGKEALMHNCYSCKPSMYIKSICQKILSNKVEFEISEKEFNKTKDTYLTSFNNKKEFEEFVHSNDFDLIARKMIENSKRKNLENEYFDLFNRVLWGLGLSKSCGRQVQYYLNENLSYDNAQRKYKLIKENAFLQIPYKLDDVNKFLESIHNEDYSFTKDDSHLSTLPNFVIAEYFTNIKFCYLFNINAIKVRGYVHTIVDNELYPIAHAPGGKSDMNYISNNILYGIETTIHKNDSQVIAHELQPCCQHLIDYVPPFDICKLILICPHPNNKIKEWFEAGAHVFLKKNKIFDFKIFDFHQISEFKTYEI